MFSLTNYLLIQIAFRYDDFFGPEDRKLAKTRGTKNNRPSSDMVHHSEEENESFDEDGHDDDDIDGDQADGKDLGDQVLVN